MTLAVIGQPVRSLASGHEGLAALAVVWLGDWAWSCPVVPAGIAVVRR